MNLLCLSKEKCLFTDEERGAGVLLLFFSSRSLLFPISLSGVGVRFSGFGSGVLSSLFFLRQRGAGGTAHERALLGILRSLLGLAF